jgi:nucleotide-binding universal stress UspA family protein
MRPIIVGVDGSDNALRAVDHAARLAAEAGAELVLLAASPLPLPIDHDYFPEGGADTSLKQQLRELLVDTQPSCLEPAEARAKQAGARLVQKRAVSGDPVEELITMADQLNASMIVVGRHGVSRIAELVLGSVSKQVASRAPCPVAVVP